MANPKQEIKLFIKRKKIQAATKKIKIYLQKIELKFAQKVKILVQKQRIQLELR